MTVGTYDEFLNALGYRESSGRYDVVSTYGYLGMYQMGELALIDIGFYRGDGTSANDWIGTWSGRLGITRRDAFLASPSAQEAAIRDYMAVNWSYLNHAGVAAYEGQVLNGRTITLSGMLASAHLVGFGGLATYLKSGGTEVPADAFGTTATEYLFGFADYETPFVADHNGADALFGGSGPDAFRGFAGDDVLVGRGGADLLHGGRGADRFDFDAIGDSAPTAQDRIKGFKHMQGDRIDVSDIDADAVAAGDQDFTFIDARAFSGAAGQLRYEVNGRITLVEADTNGDRTADFAIVLAGRHALQGVDFVL